MINASNLKIRIQHKLLNAFKNRICVQKTNVNKFTWFHARAKCQTQVTSWELIIAHLYYHSQIQFVGLIEPENPSIINFQVYKGQCANRFVDLNLDLNYYAIKKVYIRNKPPQKTRCTVLKVLSKVCVCVIFV